MPAVAIDHFLLTPFSSIYYSVFQKIFFLFLYSQDQDLGVGFTNSAQQMNVFYSTDKRVNHWVLQPNF